jgi:Icc-related predicted phosphoesterase
VRLRLYSDLHLEFAPFEPAPGGADVIVLAGDIGLGVDGIRWAARTFTNTPVLYVAGNHEYYGYDYPRHVDDMRAAAKGTTVQFLENGRTEIDGIIFLGCTLWTDFTLFGDRHFAMAEAEACMNDYRMIRRSETRARLRAADTLAIHQASRQWLEAELSHGKDRSVVVITHHAPSLKSMPFQYKEDIVSAAYASPLDSMIAERQPRVWLHGHTHTACNYEIGSTRVVCNPRGYPGESGNGFNNLLLIEI